MKITSFSKKDPASVKAQFIKKYPDYANWSHWDSFGYPMPDPTELSTGVDLGDFETLINSIDKQVSSEEENNAKA